MRQTSSTNGINYKRLLLFLFAGLSCIFTIHKTSYSQARGGFGFGLFSSTLDLDVVLSYYSEDPKDVAKQVSDLRQLLETRGVSHRFILYSKNPSTPINNRLKDETNVDEVRVIGNRGREGGTFLTHIIHHYDDPSTPRHVVFSQALIERFDLASVRLRGGLGPTTSFMSLYHYSRCDCGKDTHGKKLYFPRMREIYSMFTSQLCPGGGQLCTYDGQFVVSWRQIRSNPKDKYVHLQSVLEADSGHWIYNDPEDLAWSYAGQPSSPSSPFFGHALERSWPVIFGCTDPKVALECSNTNLATSCQCHHSA